MYAPKQRERACWRFLRSKEAIRTHGALLSPLLPLVHPPVLVLAILMTRSKRLRGPTPTHPAHTHKQAELRGLDRQDARSKHIQQPDHHRLPQHGLHNPWHPLRSSPLVRTAPTSPVRSGVGRAASVVCRRSFFSSLILILPLPSHNRRPVRSRHSRACPTLPRLALPLLRHGT